MVTLLTGAGLAALAAGVFVIAKSRLVSSHRKAGTGQNTDAAAASALFAREDDRRIAARFGVSIIALGAILVLLDIAGIVLSASTATIVSFLVVVFLVSHDSYAKHLRAARSERAAALHADEEAS